MAIRVKVGHLQDRSSVNGVSGKSVPGVTYLELLSVGHQSSTSSWLIFQISHNRVKAFSKKDY